MVDGVHPDTLEALPTAPTDADREVTIRSVLAGDTEIGVCRACYGELLMPSFHQPRPRPGFLIDTSSSMEDSQLARALAELAGLTRQLGYGADVVVACCDAAVRDVRKVFGAGQVELYGGGGTDLDVGLRAFIERTHDPIDLLVIVSDCHTTWSNDVPPFPVIIIRVGDGAPPPWGHRPGNTVISIEDRRG